MGDGSEFWLQLILGTIVLIPSIWTIWKNYYDKFKIAVILNNIYMGIHEWDNGNRFEVRFFVPMEVINISNSMGIISDMRIKIRYQIKGHIYYYEYTEDNWELISQNKKKFDFSARGTSFDTIIKNENISFSLKPQQSCKKHILFRIFWKNLKILDKFQVILEIQLNSKGWKKYGSWMGHLQQFDYDMFISKENPILFVKEFNRNWIMQKWKKYMEKKINKKYDKNVVNIQKINLPSSKSKW